MSDTKVTETGLYSNVVRMVGFEYLKIGCIIYWLISLVADANAFMVVNCDSKTATTANIILNIAKVTLMEFSVARISHSA